MRSLVYRRKVFHSLPQLILRCHILFNDSEVSLNKNRPVSQLNISETIGLRRDFSRIFTDTLEALRIDS